MELSHLFLPLPIILRGGGDEVISWNATNTVVVHSSWRKERMEEEELPPSFPFKTPAPASFLPEQFLAGSSSELSFVLACQLDGEINSAPGQWQRQWPFFSFFFFSVVAMDSR